MLLIIQKIKLIHITKKKLQLLFKKFGYRLFKLIYPKINEFENIKQNISSNITLSKINKDFTYNVFIINNARLYTDTVSDCAVIQNNKVLEGPSFQIRDTKFENIKKNNIFIKGTPKIKKKVKGKVLSLLTGGAGNYNYWHWLFDVLPRIKIAQNVLNIDDIDYFLFPNVSKKFQKETINFLNIPLKKCLSSINFRHFECNQLIVTNHPYVINNEPTSEIQNLPEWIIIWLQNTFMQKNQLAYEVQDIPNFIQYVLMKYGEKEHIGESEYLRIFSENVLKKLKEKFGLNVLSQIVEHSNAYLVHSNDGKTIITMGKYLNQ